MSVVTRLKCDGCNREVDDQSGAVGRRPASVLPRGWWRLEGVWDGECPDTELHFHSTVCLNSWTNRRILTTGGL